jgi:hypothetical protein
MQPKLYTSKEVADQLGVSHPLVRKIACRDNIGTKIGRDRLFTEADVERIRNRPLGKPGRPRKEQQR